MTGGKPGISPGTPNIEYDQYGTPIKEIVTPATTGLLDIDAAKKQYLEDTIKNQNLQVDAAARRASGLTRPSTPAETAANPSGSTEFNKVPTTPPGSTPSTSTQPPNTGAKPTIANPLPGFSGSTPAVNPVTAQMIARGMPAPGTPAFNQQGARPSGPLPGQQGGPSSSPTASSSAQPGTKKTYSSLYAYYSANGGWNTLDSKRRKADAKAAGIDGYTGTAAQNRVLLSHLQGQGTSPITPSMTLPGINMSTPAANMSTPSGNKYVPPPSLGGSNPYRPIPAATMSPPEKPLDGGNAQSPYGPLPAASRMATLPEEKPWAPGGGLNATGASGGNPKQIMVGGQIINL